MACKWCQLGYSKVGDAHLYPHDPFSDIPQEKPVFQCEMENVECQNEIKLSS